MCRFFFVVILYSAAGCVFAFTSRVLYYYDALRGEFTDRISISCVLMPRTHEIENRRRFFAYSFMSITCSHPRVWPNQG